MWLTLVWFPASHGPTALMGVEPKHKAGSSSLALSVAQTPLPFASQKNVGAGMIAQRAGVHVHPSLIPINPGP